MASMILITLCKSWNQEEYNAHLFEQSGDNVEAGEAVHDCIFSHGDTSGGGSATSPKALMQVYPIFPAAPARLGLSLRLRLRLKLRLRLLPLTPSNPCDISRIHSAIILHGDLSLRTFGPSEFLVDQVH